MAYLNVGWISEKDFQHKECEGSIMFIWKTFYPGFILLLKYTLKWRHNEHDGVLNHRRLHCLL